jgi:hypothetical protein
LAVDLASRLVHHVEIARPARFKQSGDAKSKRVLARRRPSRLLFPAWRFWPGAGRQPAFFDNVAWHGPIKAVQAAVLEVRLCRTTPRTQHTTVNAMRLGKAVDPLRLLAKIQIGGGKLHGPWCMLCHRGETQSRNPVE